MAISLSNLATSETCQYKNEDYNFTCDEPTTRGTGSKFCIFHDINYLKDDNYEKHKGEVSRRFEEKLSECPSNNRPLEFMGYYLPDVSFRHKQLTEALYFDKATFYGEADFSGATFSKKAEFLEAMFSSEAYFYGATFSSEANFYGATFSKKAEFSRITFLSKAYFSGEFKGSTYFNYTIFEEPTKVTFDISKMSKVSFSDSDITRIRFSDKVTSGGKDEYTIIEEEDLKYSFDWENITTTDEHINRLKDFLRQSGMNWKVGLQFTKIDHDTISIRSTFNSLSVDDDSSGATIQKDKGSYYFAKEIGQIKLDHKSKKAILSIDGEESYEFVVKEENDKLMIYPNEKVSLESVMAIYRNLRENYEYRLRYDEAGKFFRKEMELKRKYRDVLSKTSNGFELKENCWFRRNLSLTGLYYRFSNYGESIAKPAIIGASLRKLYNIIIKPISR